MLLFPSSNYQQLTIITMVITVLSMRTVNSAVIGSNGNNNLDSVIGSTSSLTTTINNHTTSITTNDNNPANNNQNQSSIVDLRERKKKERLSLIKSSILAQLGRNLPADGLEQGQQQHQHQQQQHHHQHNLNHQTDQTNDQVNHNQLCYLTKAERNILSDIFTMIRKTPEGTIDVNQFLTNQQIIEKLQGLRTNSWACVRTAIFASADHQRNPFNSTLLPRPPLFPINSSSFSSSSSSSSSIVIGHHLFDQSGLSNKSLSDYQNDNVTQQLILEQRQRKKQERLIFIQQQILSRLGLTQRANETIHPCKLTDSERALVDQVFDVNGKTESESNSNQLTQSNNVLTKLQGFYLPCKINLINQPNNSISS